MKKEEVVNSQIMRTTSVRFGAIGHLIGAIWYSARNC